MAYGAILLSHSSPNDFSMNILQGKVISLSKLMGGGGTTFFIQYTYFKYFLIILQYKPLESACNPHLSWRLSIAQTSLLHIIGIPNYFKSRGSYNRIIWMNEKLVNDNFIIHVWKRSICKNECQYFRFGIILDLRRLQCNVLLCQTQ